MASGKKKQYFYYVLVLTQSGPVFVTEVENSPKTAYWNKDEKPLELGSSCAEDVAFGLRVNFYQAFTVKSLFEIDAQPYFYDKGEFKWVWKDDKGGEA